MEYFLEDNLNQTLNTTSSVYDFSNVSLKETLNNYTKFDEGLAEIDIYHGPIMDAVHSKQFMILVPAFVYTAILMLIGMPGNGIVIIIYRLKMSRTTSRHFIIALAVCDFVNCAFGMPVELSLLANYYKFDHPILCKVSRFSTFFMNNTSSLVLLGIAVDRFRRVCLPLRPNMTVYHSKVICCTSVVMSVALAIPSLLIFGTLNIRVPIGPIGTNSTTFMVLKACYVNELDTKLPMIFSLCLIIGTLSIFVALVVLYALVGRAVCRRRNADYCVDVRKLTQSEVEMTTVQQTQLVRRNAFSQRIWRSISSYSPKLRHGTLSEQDTRSRTVSDASVRRHGGKGIRAGRTTTILFLVTLSYMLTFVPYLVLSTMRHINPHYADGMTSVEKSVYNVTLRSYLLNSAVNPIIYCFLNRQFRLKVKLFFLNLFKCRGKA